ncbi:MAG: ABC transporter permease [Woeseiaceae bacterium]
MMSWLTQILSVTTMNLKSLPQRLAPSVVAIIGVGAVVGVFAGVLSMASGFEKTMLAAGSEQSAIAIRAGSSGELSSGIGNDQAQLIANAPGVLRDDDGPVVSAELYVLVDIAKRSNNQEANVPLRGVQAGAFKVRDNVSIVEGRTFEPGKNELIVGRAAQQEFIGLEVGGVIPFGLTEWTVVGAFAANGSVSESELWTDVRVLQSIYRRGNSFQSVRVKLESPNAIETFEQALKDDPRVETDVYSEKTFYSQQSENLAQFIRLVGYPITILMAIGAIFGALNTMYSSVSARGKEIATLRALGFGPLSILTSTIIESAALAVLGGILGGGLAWLFLNGYTVSTLNGPSFSQVVFDFAVTPDLLADGLVAAIIIGLVGGLFPAIRAVRIPVSAALREL